MFKRSLRLSALVFGLLFASFVYAQSVNALLRSPNDPSVGNPKSPVTIVEFFDFECSHCQNMAPVMAQFIKTHPDVRVVFKDYPIRGDMSEYAARAALAANMQGKYYPFQHALLSANTDITQQLTLDVAKSLKMNLQQFKTDMHSARVTKQINANLRMGKELQLPGTPTFFVGKSNAKSIQDLYVNVGEMSSSDLQNAVNKAK